MYLSYSHTVDNKRRYQEHINIGIYTHLFIRILYFSVWYPFISARRTPLAFLEGQVWCQWTSSCLFVWGWPAFFFISRGRFARCKTLGWQFSFGPLAMASQSFLAFTVSDEKFSVTLTEGLLYWSSCFSLAAFKVFSSSFASNNLVSVCLGVDFFALVLPGVCRVFCLCRFMSFIFWEISAIIFSNILSSPFSPVLGFPLCMFGH